jgi:hypothetical protein
MQPSGAMAGSKGKQVAYRWRLRSEDGWWLLLMNRSQPHETMPNGIVRASSLPLLRLGSLGYLQQVEETLDDLRIRLVREKLSRVDPCADLSGLRIDGLYQAFMQGHFVSRARYTTNHIAEESYEGYRIGRKPTGFEFGKGGAVGMRVYDKARKCSGDSEMLLLMQTRRWGDVGGWATRAEFELRREKLKALGVDSIAQWWEKRGSICEYLAHKWCRITAEEVDSRHADRAATHPDWVKFQDAFKEWAGQPVAKLEPLTRLPVRADHLLSQIVGSLVSYYARVGTRIDSNESFVEESIEKIFDSICDRDMPREVWRRALELGAPRQ